MTKKITLAWLNKIKEDLVDIRRDPSYNFPQYTAIKKFLRPIIAYGEKEEERINKGFKNGSEDLEQTPSHEQHDK